MKKRLLVGLAACITLGATDANPQVVVGAASFPAGNCIPFGCHLITRYQQVYSAAVLAPLFPNPASINQLRFFYNGWDTADGPVVTDVDRPIQPATYTFRLSTTTAPVSGFNGDFYTPSSATEFFSQVNLAGETLRHGEALLIPGTTAFDYDASAGANLLLDIMITANGGTELPNFPNNLDYNETLYFDSNPFTFGTYSRAFQVGVAPTGQPQGWPPGTSSDGWGMTTEFAFGPSQTVVPEPATIGLLATGLIGIAGVARRRRKQSIEDC